MKRREVLISLGSIAFLYPKSFLGKSRSEEMKKEIKTDKAPKAIGPYSQGIAANGFVFVSGQIPIDPQTNELNTGTIEDQTRQVLKNLSAILEAAGTSLDNAVKTTVFLQDMNDFANMNKVYAEFFNVPFPARATVQVARLPREVKVEIEAMAALNK